MARKMVLRHRASPKAAFEERANEPAGEFIDRVGLLFYGAEWTPAALHALRDRGPHATVGSDANLAEVVREQVISGLRSGRLTAFVWLTVPAWAPVRNGLLPSDWDDLSADELAAGLEQLDDPLLGEDATPKQREFIIKADYWRLPVDELGIDWLASTIAMSTKYLYDTSFAQRRDRPINDFYQVADIVRNVPLRIRYPLRALRNLVRYEDPPDEAWLKRYDIYRERGRYEALAAMWRYIAISGVTPANLPSATVLASAVSDYLAAQGLGRPRDAAQARHRSSGLEEMASLVLGQLKERDLSGSVLVSSNPRNRRPA